MVKKIAPFLSPLRYPGGKAVLGNFLCDVLVKNGIYQTYCEAYAGGAGAALYLLFSEKVDRIILNDADVHIYSFWQSILHETQAFIQRIRTCRISMAEWHRQREIYDNPQAHTEFEIGFSTFFLNRCNRGGILPNAGPIGGFEQDGNYLINARFNKKNLIERIQNIASYANRIELYDLDATDFLAEIVQNEDPNQTLLYLDPPYFYQGKKLYHNFYEETHHQGIEVLLSGMEDFRWLVSYDNVQPIAEIYSNYRQFSFDLNYSVQVTKKGKELMIFSNNLRLPDYFKLGKLKEQLIFS